MSGLFRARYPGACPCCGDRIDVGDWLRYAGDDIACKQCQSVDGPITATLAATCERCRLAGNGILIAGLCPDCRADAW